VPSGEETRDAAGPVSPADGGLANEAGTGGSWFGIACTSGPCTVPAGWEPSEHVQEAFKRARDAVPGFESTVRWANVTFGANAPACEAAPDTACLDWTYTFWAGDDDKIATLKSVVIDVKSHAVQSIDGPPFDWRIRTESELTPTTWKSVASLLKTFSTPKAAFAISGGDIGEHLGVPGSPPTFCLFPITGEEYACFDLLTGAKVQ
jgi:hypothetical protein